MSCSVYFVLLSDNLSMKNPFGYLNLIDYPGLIVSMCLFCMCMHEWVGAYAYVYVLICECKYALMCACVRAYVHACMSECMCLCVI